MFSAENTKKTKNGNDFNAKFDKDLQKFIGKNITAYKKEKCFNKIGGYDEDNIRIDHYFETVSRFKINGKFRPLRIAIDNTTTIRLDRYRDKEYESLLLKTGDCIDILLVNTLDYDDYILQGYQDPEKEVKYIKKMNNQIVDKKRKSFTDNVLPRKVTLAYLEELFNYNPLNDEYTEIVDRLNEKYKLN